MGQQGSKSTIEARVIFQRVGAVDMCQKTDACSTPASVVRIQKRVNSEAACLHSSTPTLEKSTPHAWPQSRCDTGLVYVMDNPTGGVWVKPGEKWTRSWCKNKIFRRNATDFVDGIKSSTPWLDACVSLSFGVFRAAGCRWFVSPALSRASVAYPQDNAWSQRGFKTSQRYERSGWTDHCNLLI